MRKLTMMQNLMFDERGLSYDFREEGVRKIEDFDDSGV